MKTNNNSPKLIDAYAIDKAISALIRYNYGQFSSEELFVIVPTAKEFLSYYLYFSNGSDKFNIKAYDLAIEMLINYGRLSFLSEQIDKKKVKIVLAEFLFGYLNNLDRRAHVTRKC